MSLPGVAGVGVRGLARHLLRGRAATAGMGLEETRGIGHTDSLRSARRGSGNGRSSYGNNQMRKRVPGVPADRGGASIDDLVQPVAVQPTRGGMSAHSEEWGLALDQVSIGMTLDEFHRRPMVRQLATDNGLTQKLFIQAYRGFRQYCMSPDGGVEPALLVLLQDIVRGDHDAEGLFPFFLAYARKMFPHLEALEDLRMISDLTQPHNWYPEARTVQRKIIFHAGPTNSGKTYHALKRFRESKSGVFCGPLKLLASEVFTKMNESGLNCDLVTGEERRFAIDNHHPSAHLSSTVEMLSTSMRVEVAVIDEIQMLRDEQRGWAWTRALLGVAADEVHLCGEPAAIDIVQKLLEPIGEHVEVRTYDRKTPLSISSSGMRDLSEIQPGDCIVCFNKKAIFSITRQLEQMGVSPAVIYGDLPPGTKLAQAAKFNDPDDPCHVLVATDAIGMGLNLNIKRVIFASCVRTGELLPNYQALQIAGRAGRFGTAYADGVATTLRNEDIGTLRDILSMPVLPIERVGIAPTFEQIETFSFHLPQASFVHLLDLFISVCSVSDLFFICTVDQMRELAELIDYIPLPLKVRYTFCIAPMSCDTKFSATAFVKMARRFSSGQCLTYDWLMEMVKWPPHQPQTLNQLVELEATYEVLDCYLWLSLRFPDMLPDEDPVREASRQLDAMIEQGVEDLVELIENEGNTGSAKKTSREKEQTGREKAAFEAAQRADREKEGKGIKLPDKRKGKRKSVLDQVMEKGLLTEEQLAQLRKELMEKEQK